jgi:hypothetical protein
LLRVRSPRSKRPSVGFPSFCLSAFIDVPGWVESERRQV